MSERQRRQTVRLAPAVIAVAVWGACQAGPEPAEWWWLPILLAVTAVAARLLVAWEGM